jgi:hypothetical protein
MARNKGPAGVVDTKNMPSRKPSGITSAMSIDSPLETGVDISGRFGPAAPNPPRGSRTPTRSPQIPTQERTHKR